MAMGTLTAADVRPFGTLCEIQATMQEIAAKKDGAGFQAIRLMVDGQDGERFYVEIDNLLKHERDTATALRHYYGLFGLEPVSRARIHVKKAEPVSKWADAL
jgi:hypothetical protein